MKLTSSSIITYNPQYITVDGAPWFPVMGEIHYSRVKRHRWERELLKMKAGGVEVISAYSIWIHHEEIEGEWDFSDNKDLRAFVETIQKCGLYCVLRIGPWAHGEVRNGGFPDWLVEKEKTGGMRLRSNDPGYLACAGKFYKKLYEQVHGMLLKEDGPIIGIQIENEYGHCGGLQGEEGEEHMRTLLAMAKEIGFTTPLYTATGWGGAVTGGMLPVMGGYCEAPWDQRLTEIEPSGNYIFTEERNDHNIGSDHGLGAGITFDMEKFPYLTAELGGGLQVTRHRRPIASSGDTAAMSMVKVGSGCNLLGYYMYHGGTNPEGKLTTLQESRETGYPNDLPVKSYDFNAPIREYGQLTDTYREIRRLTMFTKDYQDRLCRAVYVPQPGNPGKPEDLRSIRTAARMFTEKTEEGTEFLSGFFFVNNYQRRYSMADHAAITPTVYDAQGNAVAIYDVMDLKDGDFLFRPFNLRVGDAILKTTNAIPLCILNRGSEEEVYVFYVREGTVPDYRLKGNLGKTSILTLTDEEALHVSKCTMEGRDYLLISDGDVIMDAEDRPELLTEVDSRRRPVIRSWPELPADPRGFRKISPAGKMYRTVSSAVLAEYEFIGELSNPVITQIAGSTYDEKTLSAEITVNGLEKLYQVERLPVDEVMLKITYTGESAEMFYQDRLTADSFYTGQVWEIGVSDLLKKQSDTIAVKIHALTEQDHERLYLQEWPDMPDGMACRIEKAETSVVYRIPLTTC